MGVLGHKGGGKMELRASRTRRTLKETKSEVKGNKGETQREKEGTKRKVRQGRQRRRGQGRPLGSVALHGQNYAANEISYNFEI